MPDIEPTAPVDEFVVTSILNMLNIGRRPQRAEDLAEQSLYSADEARAALAELQDPRARPRDARRLVGDDARPAR